LYNTFFFKIKIKYRGWEHGSNGSACLANMRPWVQTQTTRKKNQIYPECRKKEGNLISTQYAPQIFSFNHLKNTCKMDLLLIFQIMNSQFVRQVAETGFESRSILYF
jgi:hypothetical protein